MEGGPSIDRAYSAIALNLHPKSPMHEAMRQGSRTAFLLAVLGGGCASAGAVPSGTVSIPPGPAWSGSDLQARASAIEYLATLSAPDTGSFVRLHAEPPPRAATLPGFVIMAHPVTQAEYARFSRATGAPEPWIDAQRWASQDTGLPYARVERMAWSDGEPPPGRRHHPVVLVDLHDAQRYCAWWGSAHGGRGTLPTEAQWIRAAGGDDGAAFPWGEAFDPGLANTWEAGVGDTTPVGAEPRAASPFGVHDLAGNVFEWTGTRVGASQSVLKGGSWSTSLVEARTSARRAAWDDLRHVEVGFRCVFEPSGAD